MNTLKQYLKEYNLKLTSDSGKEIARQKDVFFTHTGIIIGENIFTGNKMVFHNHPDSGPSLVTITKYASGFSWNYTNRKSDSLETVLLRSFKQLESGADYKLMSYNCQDATSYSRQGLTNSHGRNGALATVGIIALFAIFSK